MLFLRFQKSHVKHPSRLHTFWKQQVQSSSQSWPRHQQPTASVSVFGTLPVRQTSHGLLSWVALETRSLSIFRSIYLSIYIYSVYTVHIYIYILYVYIYIYIYTFILYIITLICSSKDLCPGISQRHSWHTFLSFRGRRQGGRAAALQ